MKFLCAKYVAQVCIFCMNITVISTFIPGKLPSFHYILEAYLEKEKKECKTKSKPILNKNS